MGAIRQRIQRFLDSSKYSRTEVVQLIELAGQAGRVAIFGGMLRDLALGGSEYFASDVDLVVAVRDPRGLAGVLEPFHPAKNTLGGYRVAFKKWKADIWDLEQTWAFREGVVRCGGFQDLPKTTFFDWDAIAYDVEAGCLHAYDHYPELLNSRVVGVNLKTNPNLFGTTVRILRILSAGTAALSPELAEYLAARLSEIDNQTIRDAINERPYADRGHPAPPLEWLECVRTRLSWHRRHEAGSIFSMNPKQQRLPFPGSLEPSFCWDR